MRRAFLVLGVLIGVYAAPIQANAALIIDWYFLNSGATYGPTEPVVHRARLVNHPDSDQHFTGQIYAASSSDFPADAGPYMAEFGPPNGKHDFFEQFVGINLAPGEIFDFVHTSYIPGGSLQVGEGSYLSMHYIGFEPSVVSLVTTELYVEWRVTELTEEPAPLVPEPATYLLFGVALAGLPLVRRRNK